jgi:hypothetical protein
VLTGAKDTAGLARMHAPGSQWHHEIVCFGLFEYLSQGVEAMCGVFNSALAAVFPGAQPPATLAHSLKTQAVWPLTRTVALSLSHTVSCVHAQSMRAVFFVSAVMGSRREETA